jgi:hypothetical protein
MTRNQTERRPDVKTSNLVNTILKAVALALSVAVILLGFFKSATVETSIALLSLAVFALALSTLNGTKQA